MKEKSDHGRVRLSFENRQRTLGVTDEMRRMLHEVTAACVEACGFPHPVEIHVTWLGSRAIRELNRRFRGKDAVTDVLSFPAISFMAGKPFLHPGDLDPDTGACFLGDLAICLPRMREQAAGYGHGETRELAFLMAHGVLHLLGLDHEVPADERHMFALQDTVLDKLGIRRENSGEPLDS